MQAQAAIHLETMLYQENGMFESWHTNGTLKPREKKKASYEMPLTY